MKFFVFYNSCIGKKVISELKIKGTDPAYANDPYEFAPRILSFSEGDRTATPRPEKIEQIRESFSKNFRVICGSVIIDEILLWSYYAKSHTGIAIEYDVSKRPFANVSDDYKGPVNYNNFRPTYFVTMNMPIDLHEKQFLNLVFHKASNWIREEEYRLLITSNDFDVNGFIDLVPESIKSVIFGFYCNPTDVQSIMDLLNRKELQHVNVAYMELLSDQYKMRICETTREEIISLLEARINSITPPE